MLGVSYRDKNLGTIFAVSTDRGLRRLRACPDVVVFRQIGRVWKRTGCVVATRNLVGRSPGELLSRGSEEPRLFTPHKVRLDRQNHRSCWTPVCLLYLAAKRSAVLNRSHGSQYVDRARIGAGEARRGV